MIKVLIIYCIQFPSYGEAAGAILIQIDIEYRHEGAVKMNNKIMNANISLRPTLMWLEHNDGLSYLHFIQSLLHPFLHELKQSTDQP